jgi:hypothetical protein
MSDQILIEGLSEPEPPRKRVVIAVDGLDKHGKTRFALSAPKPLVYLDFDIGKEGVIEKAPNPGGIITSEPFLFLPSEITFDIDNEDERTKKVMAAADPQLTRFRKTYLSCLRQPLLSRNGRKLKARTVVVDTGTEAWQLLRLCYLGKISQVKPHHYVEVNGLMRDLVRAAFESDVNVIWLHKLKAEWKDNAEGKGRKTGTLERDGFEGMSYLVQANLLCYRVPAWQAEEATVKWKSGEGSFQIPLDPRDTDDLGFRLVVGNSRHDPGLESLILSNDNISFPTIARMMLPATSEEDWLDTV